jgi:hypothetical protein
LRSREALLGEGTEAAASKNLASVSSRKTLLAQIKSCEDELAALIEAAKPDSIFVQLRRLPPNEYQAIQEQCIGADGKLAFDKQWPMLLQACYVNTLDADGADMELGYDELLSNVLTSVDFDTLAAYALQLNRSAATIPFTQGNSGRPGIS